MKVIIAPDKFKGSLSASDAARAMASGVRRVFPRAKMVLAPVADGGEGTMETLVHETRGVRCAVEVADPLGKPVKAAFGILGPVTKRRKQFRPGMFAGRTAVLEMAEASGLKHVPPNERNPLITTTFGVGQLIRAALDAGCTKIIIGIGGSATNDAGAGMAQALGWRLLDKHGYDISFGGGALKDIARILPPQREFRLPKVSILVACDVKNPLYGKNGAAYVYAPQKGASPAMVRTLDRNLRHFARVVKRDLGQDISRFPGSGAAGGLGAGLVAFLDAKLSSGAQLVLETIRFDELLRGANLVITGEGKIDEQTAHGKAPWSVAEHARRRGIPVIAFGGVVPARPSANLVNQFNLILPLSDKRISLKDSMRRAASLLETAVVRALRGGKCPGLVPVSSPNKACKSRR